VGAVTDAWVLVAHPGYDVPDHPIGVYSSVDAALACLNAAREREGRGHARSTQHVVLPATAERRDDDEWDVLGTFTQHQHEFREWGTLRRFTIDTEP
jgi:hypothetical protein